MRMYDLIEKKKRGGALSREEIHQMISGFVSGEIPDYQMAAMLMAICFQGMNPEETAYLTEEMADSGDRADLSAIPGVKADKHSTGGVGDKTTLIAGPIAASCGVRVAKMSGRGLGHTGGTLDKLESIPGFQTSVSRERFFEIVRQTGIAVIGQTGNMVPADKKLYALRDVTATVDSIPLIASSIMSKKLAAGSDCIVLDVKTGSGAFMKTLEDSLALAREMVDIGTRAGRRCCALITDMDVPLGHAIGNALEVKEAVEVLQGRGPEELTRVSLQLAACMLFLAGKGSREACLAQAEKALEDGSGLRTLAAMTEAQGGDARCIREPERLGQAPYCREVRALKSGWIVHMDAEACGIASMILGAGRARKEDAVDPLAGMILKRKYGEYVQAGDVLAELYSSDPSRFPEAEEKTAAAFGIGEEQPPRRKQINALVSDAGIDRF